MHSTASTLWSSGGEFVAISGRAGCGKSTLLHLAALDTPTSATILHRRARPFLHRQPQPVSAHRDRPGVPDPQPGAVVAPRDDPSLEASWLSTLVFGQVVLFAPTSRFVDAARHCVLQLLAPDSRGGKAQRGARRA